MSPSKDFDEGGSSLGTCPLFVSLPRQSDLDSKLFQSPLIMQQKNCEAETLKVFRLLTSQVRMRMRKRVTFV